MAAGVVRNSRHSSLEKIVELNVQKQIDLRFKQNVQYCEAFLLLFVAGNARIANIESKQIFDS